MKPLPDLSRSSQRRLALKHHQTLALESAKQMVMGLMVPMAMMILNLAMFNVALPAVRDTFTIPADMTAWLVTAYMLPFIIFMPLYGRLGDGLGKRRLLLIGVSVFLAGTVIDEFGKAAKLNPSAYFTRLWIPRKLAVDVASSRMFVESILVLIIWERCACKVSNFCGSRELISTYTVATKLLEVGVS